jgi:hypothetical protein
MSINDTIAMERQMNISKCQIDTYHDKTKIYIQGYKQTFCQNVESTKIKLLVFTFS